MNQQNISSGHGRGVASGNATSGLGGRGRGGRGRGRDDPVRAPQQQSQATFTPPPPPPISTSTSNQSQNVNDWPQLGNNSGINTQMSQIVVPKPTPIKEPEKVASVVDNKPQKLIPVAKEAWPPKQEINQSQPQQSTLTTRNEEESKELITIQFAKKPSQRGTLGRKIRLSSNHYTIEINANQRYPVIHTYDVSIERSNQKSSFKRNDGEKRLIKNKDLLKEIFKSFYSQLDANVSNKIFSDLSKNLYSVDFELPNSSYKVIVENQEFTVTIQKTGEVTINNENQTDLNIIQILNIVMTHKLSLNFLSADRSFFTDKILRDIGLGIDLWKGTFASVRPSECGLTWNLNIDIAAFFSSENLVQLAFKYYNVNFNESKLLDLIYEDAHGKEIGLSFIESIIGREVKLSTSGFRKRIKGFAYDKNGKICDSFHQIIITNNDGKSEKMTIKEYTEKHYKDKNIKIKYPNLPCIDLSTKNNPIEVFVPMEICTTQQKQTKKLDTAQHEIVRKQTTLNPADRMNEIQKWANSHAQNQDPILSEFGINVDLKNRVETEGRVLEAPDIQYGNQKFVFSPIIGVKGSWIQSEMKFFRPTDIKQINWAIINVAYGLNKQKWEPFVRNVQNIGRKHGINGIQEPFFQESYESRQFSPPLKVLADIKRIFERILDKAKETNRPLNMIVAFFSNENDLAYKAIKTCADLSEHNFGIATQCIMSKNVIACKDQVISNILLKINSKLCGTNFVLSQNNQTFIEYLKPLFNENLMIFGADVTHPSPQPGCDLSESIAAVTASIDKDCSYYITRLLAQRKEIGKKQEMIIELDKVFKELVLEYKNRNNAFPRRIVFFRDGVSEGEFSLVFRYEINAIRKACSQISNGYKPGITFVVVQKRHQTRFFPMDEKTDNGRNDYKYSGRGDNNFKPKPNNIPPGTVVDKALVTPDLYDFFLCSHYGIQGTSKPCRYFVLHDENNLGMDHMQLLAYYLCHIYSRTSRSVSYPAPAYYSHLAAFRGREYIRNVDKNRKYYEIKLHERIKNTMFYT